MRALLVSIVVAAAVAIVAPAASAYRLPYAVFKVSVTGTQTTQVSGADECQDDVGTVAPATASSTASFKTTKPKKLEFYKPDKLITVVPPGRGGGNTKIKGAGSLTRQSGFALNGTLPPVCAGGQPNPGCGTTQLSSVVFLVQGGVNSVNLQVSAIKPSPGICPVPASFEFPELVQPGDNGTGAHIVHFSARVPRSLLNPHKHVVVIHGSGEATNKGQEGAIHVTSATTTLKFTMRLVRVRLR
ncbi:MAG TPA: hypothetical protein VH817_06665 [Thermoleophilaceae bacterium]|jgi:hypothetical protein